MALRDTIMNDAADVRVSYIISTRNRARFLAQALANVREYITPQDELLVMDGGSTDDTPAVIAANRDLVWLFVSEPDKGEAHGLNKGMLAARGRIIKFLTDDDYIFPLAMGQAIELMESNPQVDALLCGGESCTWDEPSGQMRWRKYLYLPPGRRLADDARNIIVFTTCGLGLLIRQRLVTQVGLLDTTFKAVDTNYLARLIAHKVDFRYAHLKLFRHCEYSHSGQLDELKMARDRMRAMLVAGRWDLCVPKANDPSGSDLVMAQLLGLDKVSFGRALSLCMIYAEWLRRLGLGFLLWPFACVGRVAAAALLALRRIFRKAAVTIPPAAQEAEVNWDGSLH
jgi:glycosyltransferase involved in cell wall biosynthesis